MINTRILAIAVTTAVGLLAGTAALQSDSKAAIAGGGVLLAVGIVGALIIAVLLYIDAEERIKKVGYSWGKPRRPIGISQPESALAGQKRIRNYNIPKWYGLVFSNKTFIGVLRMDDPITTTYKDYE